MTVTTVTVAQSRCLHFFLFLLNRYLLWKFQLYIYLDVWDTPSKITQTDQWNFILRIRNPKKNCRNVGVKSYLPILFRNALDHHHISENPVFCKIDGWNKRIPNVKCIEILRCLTICLHLVKICIFLHKTGLHQRPSQRLFKCCTNKTKKTKICKKKSTHHIFRCIKRCLTSTLIYCYSGNWKILFNSNSSSYHKKKDRQFRFHPSRPAGPVKWESGSRTKGSVPLSINHSRWQTGRQRNLSNRGPVLFTNLYVQYISSIKGYSFTYYIWVFPTAFQFPS